MTILTLQPDAAAGKDVSLRNDISYMQPRNYGVMDALLANQGVATSSLLKFDLSSIPSGAICNSAVLSLFHHSAAGANTYTISIYSVAAANAAWIEGTKNNTTAGAGESCWDALAADGAGGVTTAWAGSAGCQTSGTDYEATAMGTATGHRDSATGTQVDISLNTTRVKGWFGASNTNYGILLKVSGGNDGEGWCSSDHATAAYRPKLVVDYTLPATGEKIFNKVFTKAFRAPFG